MRRVIEPLRVAQLFCLALIPMSLYEGVHYFIMIFSYVTEQLTVNRAIV